MLDVALEKKISESASSRTREHLNATCGLSLCSSFVLKKLNEKASQIMDSWIELARFLGLLDLSSSI